MKRLKKALSIMLVISMVMSVCPFAFASTTPTDAEKTTQAQKQIEGGNTPKYYTWNGTGFNTTPDTDPMVLNHSTNTKVWLSKTIAPTGIENEFDITLDVWTKNVDIRKSVPAPAAVTLVIDLSGSMHSCSKCNYVRNANETLGDTHHIDGDRLKGYCPAPTIDRLDAAKTAAKQFIEKYAGTDRNVPRYISIVVYSYNAEIKQDWIDLNAGSDNLQSVKNIIDGIQHTGRCTNTTYGLAKAEQLLLNSSFTSKNIKNKFVVLLTDGVPYTDNVDDYSKKINNDGTESNSNIANSGEYSLSTIGYTIDSFIGSNNTDGETAGYNYAAMRAARIRGTGASQLNTKLYSVGFGLSIGQAQNWLKAISNQVFDASTGNELLVEFDNVVNSIKSEVQPWVVTDPMGDYITCTNTYDNNSPVSLKNGEIKWDLQKSNNIATTEETNAGKSHYQETYRVKLDVVKAIADNKDLSKYFLTNKETYLEYSLPVTEMVDNVETTYFVNDAETKITSGSTVLKKDFKVPAVKGYAADLSFTKNGYKSGSLAPLSGASFKLTKTGNGTAFTAAANSNENGTVSFSKIPSGETYILSEENAPAGFEEVADRNITVSYGVISEGIENGGTITDPRTGNKISVDITKKWVAPAAEIPGSITVTLKRNGVGLREYTNFVISIADDAAHKATVDNNGVWHYTFKDLPETDEYGNLYTYTVAETEPSGFDASYGSDGLSITNTITGTTQVKVVKNWILPAGFNGTVPDVTVTLTADGESTGKTADLSNGATYTFDNLDKYSNGKLVNYAVTEADGDYQQVSVVESVAEGVKTFTITNTLANETIDLSGQKFWNDDGDTSARKPVTVELLKNSVATGTTAEANAENEWRYTFEKLAKYEFTQNENGQITGVSENVYSVKELTEVEGYTSSVSGMNVTNTRVGTTSFTVTKEWIDVPGTEHSNVTVTLRANNAALNGPEYTKTFSESCTFENLAKYDSQGKVIVYDVIETPVEGYAASYSAVSAGVYEQTVTNKKIVTEDDKVTLIIAKEWHTVEDISKLTAEFTVTGTLQNCENTTAAAIALKTYTVKITGNSSETPSYPKYFEYEDNIYEYVYKVKESSVPAGYGCTGGKEEGKENSWKFVNTISGNTEVTVKKIWVKPDDVEKVDVSFNVFQNESTEPYTIITISKDDADASETIFVPKYDSNGQVITYRVEEIVPSGFSADVPVKTEGKFEFTVTNRVNDKTKDVTVSKTWLDDSRSAAERPDVTLTLSNAGEVKFTYDAETAKVMAIVGETAVEAVLSDNNNTYSYTFEDLPVYNSGKTGYVEYVLTEPANPAGYIGSVSDMVATNKRVGNIGIDITKYWIDPEGAERPEITMVLSGSDGSAREIVFSKNESGTVTAKLGDQILGEVSGNSWTVTVPELPEYDANGKKIEYSLSENDVTGYTKSSVEGQPFAVKNVIEQEYVGIGAVKIWDNMIEKSDVTVYAAEYPEAISVALYRNGLQVPGSVKSVERGEDGKYEIAPYTGLEKYNLETGAVYTYTIKEVDNGEGVENNGTISFGEDNEYVVTYETAQDGTVVITNTFKVPEKYMYDITCRYYHYNWNGDLISSYQTVSDIKTETQKNTVVNADPEDYTVCEEDELTYEFDAENATNVLSVSLDEENFLYHLVLNYVLTDEVPYAQYGVVHEYYTNGSLDGSSDTSYYSEKVGTVVDEDDVEKVVTYDGNTYEYTSASPESITVYEDGIAIITLRYDRTYTPSRPHKPVEQPEEPEEPEPIVEPEEPIVEEPEIIEELPEEEVPLAGLPEEPEELDIFEEEVPLADVPTTGDHSVIWFVLSIMAALGLAVLTIEEKKARQF